MTFISWLSYLNLNLGLTGKGRAEFKKAKSLNGLDVWRRLVVPSKPKTVTKKVEVHSDVHSPPKCKHIGEVIDHLDKWERELQ